MSKLIYSLLCRLNAAIEIRVHHLVHALPKHLRHVILNLAEVVYRTHNRSLERLFIYGRRVMALPFAVLYSIDTPPFDLFEALCRPCHSSVMRSALSADKQFRQCIFCAVLALLGFSEFFSNGSFSGSPCHFFLHPIEIGTGYYRFMVVLYQVHRQLTVIFSCCFCNAVGHICLLEKRITRIFLVHKNALYGFGFPCRILTLCS